MERIQTIVHNMLEDDYKTVNSLVKITSGNEITDQIRTQISFLEGSKIQIINKRLEKILASCYFTNDLNLRNFTREEIFLLKENLIYYLGRITTTPNLELLKRIYYLEENNHLKLNITFATLPTGDEEIEKDFIKQIEPGNELDLLIRSWTLAFYTNSKTPYEYIDKKDDWTPVKKARLKRLAINDESSLKFSKAKAYRYLDLLIIYLFLINRGFTTMTKEDYQIIENLKVDFKDYSKEKINSLRLLKNKIITKNPYKG